MVGGFNVDPAELPTRGGEATVTITGRNLPDGITVKCGGQTVATAGSSIKQTAKLMFPANTGREDIVYDIQYSLDGVTFEGDLSVTVFVNRYDADDATRDIPVSVLIPTAGDSQSGEGPERALDNDLSTLWHTNWYGTSRTNHWIQFELREDYIVDGLRYKPRENGSTNGNITEYQVQISNDGLNFETVKSGSWEGNSNWKIASFTGVQAKFVRLVAVNARSDSSYVFASAAEIRLTGSKEVAHEHSYTAVVTAPTCTEGGYTTYTCECGESYTDNETPALGHEWKGTKCVRCDATRVNPFEDVAEDSWYINFVLWAVENGITTGMDATHFAPDANVTRAQVVTFLWAAAGRPEPKATVNPFVDVATGDWYYKAVLWAVENGITSGMDATHFAPNDTCLREQVVTFLYAAAGRPAATAAVNFSDVQPGAWYYAPVAWAVENGITSGMGDGTFGVGATCTRAQIVTFLYQSYSE